MATAVTLVHILDGNKMLLKMGVRGISKGKWNAPGGKIEAGETPEQNALREAYEETGLRLRNLEYHGELKFFLGGKNELSFHSYLFSTKEFSGNARSTEEGEVRWFELDEIPYDKMWPDDIFWIPKMLAGQKFDADFFFDGENKKITRHEFRMG